MFGYFYYNIRMLYLYVIKVRRPLHFAVDITNLTQDCFSKEIKYRPTKFCKMFSNIAQVCIYISEIFFIHVPLY